MFLYRFLLVDPPSLGAVDTTTPLVVVAVGSSVTGVARYEHGESSRVVTSG